MNNDVNLIFEAYKRDILLNELDLGAGLGDILGAATTGYKERKGKAASYIFDKLEKENPDKSPEEIVKMIVEPLYEVLFQDGRFVATGELKDQLTKLQNAVQEELSKKYPKAISGYTARIIRNFVAPVVKALDSEAGDVDADVEAVAAVRKAVKQVVKDNEVQAPAEAPVGEEGADRDIERLRSQAVEFVGGDTVKEADVLNHIKQSIINSDSEISEGRAKGKAAGIINSLVSAGVLDKKNGMIAAGDKADEYAEKGDLSLVSAEPEDYLAATGRHGGRSTTGRQAWGGEGGPMSSYFG